MLPNVKQNGIIREWKFLGWKDRKAFINMTSEVCPGLLSEVYRHSSGVRGYSWQTCFFFLRVLSLNLSERSFYLIHRKWQKSGNKPKKQQYFRIVSLGLMLQLTMVYSNWKEMRLNITTAPSKIGNADNTWHYFTYVYVFKYAYICI